MLSSHTGSFAPPPFYLIKSLYNCTSAAPMSSIPSVKRSTVRHAPVAMSAASAVLCTVLGISLGCHVLSHNMDQYMPEM